MLYMYFSRPRVSQQGYAWSDESSILSEAFHDAPDPQFTSVSSDTARHIASAQP
ncbi:hypothetical protein J3F84DRAFT_383311 [Trichoderma pleuroticola]